MYEQTVIEVIAAAEGDDKAAKEALLAEFVQMLADSVER